MLHKEKYRTDNLCGVSSGLVCKPWGECVKDANGDVDDNRPGHNLNFDLFDSFFQGNIGVREQAAVPDVFKNNGVVLTLEHSLGNFRPIAQIAG